MPVFTLSFCYSLRVVSKAMTDTAPASCHGAPLAPVGMGLAQHAMWALPDPHQHPRTWTASPKLIPNLLLGLSGTGSQQKREICPPTAKRSKWAFALAFCLLCCFPAVNFPFVVVIFYYIYFFLSVSDQAPVSGDSKMTQKPKSNFFHRWIVAEGEKCKCIFSSVLRFGVWKGCELLQFP